MNSFMKLMILIRLVEDLCRIPCSRKPRNDLQKILDSGPLRSLNHFIAALKID